VPHAPQCPTSLRVSTQLAWSAAPPNNEAAHNLCPSGQAHASPVQVPSSPLPRPPVALGVNGPTSAVVGAPPAPLADGNAGSPLAQAKLTPLMTKLVRARVKKLRMKPPLRSG
jgi:hypothetical protein